MKLKLRSSLSNAQTIGVFCVGAGIGGVSALAPLASMWGGIWLVVALIGVLIIGFGPEAK